MLQPNDPPEVFAYQSDRIVVGNVLAEGEPKEVELALPGEAKAAAVRVTEYSFHVSGEIKPDAELAQSTPGPAQPIRIMMAVRGEKGMAAKEQVKTLAPLMAATGAGLKKDAMFVVYLQRTSIKDAYLAIKVTPFNQRGDDDAARRAADVAKWPWGKAEKGLQMAVFVKTPLYQGKDGSVRMQFFVAMRNQSEKPLKVNCYAGDSPVSLVVKDSGAAAKPGEVYGHNDGKAREMRAFGDIDIATIPAAGVIFLGPYTAAAGPFLGVATLEMGKHQLQFGYTSKRTEENLELWTGSVEAKPIEVDVKEMPIMRN
ncbi:MAG TPA: hypothetical protein VIL86_07845 [Tepidisphaeraceae bacterium]